MKPFLQWYVDIRTAEKVERKRHDGCVIEQKNKASAQGRPKRIHGYCDTLPAQTLSNMLPNAR